jgi:hypothetical protein
MMKNASHRGHQSCSARPRRPLSIAAHTVAPAIASPPLAPTHPSAGLATAIREVGGCRGTVAILHSLAAKRAGASSSDYRTDGPEPEEVLDERTTVES